MFKLKKVRRERIPGKPIETVGTIEMVAKKGFMVETNNVYEEISRLAVGTPVKVVVTPMITPKEEKRIAIETIDERVRRLEEAQGTGIKDISAVEPKEEFTYDSIRNAINEAPVVRIPKRKPKRKPKKKAKRRKR